MNPLSPAFGAIGPASIITAMDVGTVRVIAGSQSIPT